MILSCKAFYSTLKPLSLKNPLKFEFDLVSSSFVVFGVIAAKEIFLPDITS
ncbi:hypothetical protein O6B42_00195 [Campylobacter ureolyticus]|uniref:hypothetical protein n=1 Tax=Campylobacter ureolyticus TaxID=827 RepID=UPI0022B45251|nr:hypothetical protein [Campylobacter ureolyticus]MCZ6132304.1 hypothetical protein [Campylobacter ureolyticus]